MAVSIACTSCGSLDKRRFDHPEARELQKDSISRFPERPIQGEGIREFFNDKVGLIAGSDPRIPSGRAVPVSKDGYYLTAWHVVSGGDYQLSDLVELQPLPKGRTFKTDDYLRSVVFGGTARSLNSELSEHGDFARPLLLPQLEQVAQQIQPLLLSHP